MAARRPAAIWSSAALAALADGWDRYAKIGGRLSADKTLRDVAAACATLQERPYGGRSRGELMAGVRSLAAGPVVVFYRVNRQEGAEVLRVLDRRGDADGVFGT